MSAEFIVGIFIAAALGSLSFFLVRFINRHDEFEKTTRTSFRTLNNRIVSHEHSLNQAVQRLETALNEAGLDSEGKARVNDLRLQVFSLRKTLKEDIVPMAKDISNNHGKVIVIERQVQSQEKKFRALYETVQILARRQ